MPHRGQGRLSLFSRVRSKIHWWILLHWWIHWWILLRTLENKDGHPWVLWDMASRNHMAHGPCIYEYFQWPDYGYRLRRQVEAPLWFSGRVTLKSSAFSAIKRTWQSSNQSVVWYLAMRKLVYYPDVLSYQKSNLQSRNQSVVWCLCMKEMGMLTSGVLLKGTSNGQGWTNFVRTWWINVPYRSMWINVWSPSG